MLLLSKWPSLQTSSEQLVRLSPAGAGWLRWTWLARDRTHNIESVLEHSPFRIIPSLAQHIVSHCSLVRLQHRRNFHHKVHERYKGVRSAPRMCSVSPRLPRDQTTWTRVTTCTDGVGSCGDQVHIWTCFRRLAVLLGPCTRSPERGTEEKGHRQECQLSLWSAWVGTPLMWPSCHLYKSLALSLPLPAMRCHRSHCGDRAGKLNTPQKHRK